jgi:large subunit ribosomal protein L25
MIPAIVYGPRTESFAVAFDPEDLIRILEQGENVLVDMTVKDSAGDSESAHVVMVRDVQIEPIKQVPLHADLYAISMDQTITIQVPLRLVGKAKGLMAGGIMEQVRRDLEVECLPADIPPYIEVDVSGMDVGDSIHVQDITVQKVKVLAEPHMTIATLVRPAAEKEAAPVEAEAEAAPAAGEAEKAEEEKE